MDHEWSLVCHEATASGTDAAAGRATPPWKEPSMRAGTGNTMSLWQATAKLPHYEPLRGDAQADVVVVGAGIAGLSCAYQLARAGRGVVVLDKGEIGAGETARTTA